jgi:hypothetical protein
MVDIFEIYSPKESIILTLSVAALHFDLEFFDLNLVIKLFEGEIEYIRVRKKHIMKMFCIIL